MGETSRHRPLFLLMQAYFDVPLSKYFSDYNIEYLQTRLSGYSKAFGEYYVFRLTEILQSMRREFGITFENETYNRKTENDELRLSILTEYYIVFLQVLMDHLAVFMPFFYADMEKHKSLVPKNPGTLIKRFKSFAQIRRVYLNKNEIDHVLASHMKNDMSWFEDINEIRNSLIHGSGWLWFEYGFQSQDPKFKKVSGYLMKKEWFPSLKDFISKSYYDFREFISFYENHFRAICEKEFAEFKYVAREHWFTVDSPFYKTMDYFYEEGKKLSLRES